MHADGTTCPKGTKSVPGDYKACCGIFEDHVSLCYDDLRYEYWNTPKPFWVIALPDGSGIHITYCPHCGSKLCL